MGFTLIEDLTRGPLPKRGSVFYQIFRFTPLIFPIFIELRVSTRYLGIFYSILVFVKNLRLELQYKSTFEKSWSVKNIVRIPLLNCPSSEFLDGQNFLYIKNEYITIRYNRKIYLNKGMFGLSTIFGNGSILRLFRTSVSPDHFPPRITFSSPMTLFIIG